MEQPAPSGYTPSSPTVVSQNVSTVEPGLQIPVIAAPVVPERRNGTPGWMIVLLVLLSLLLIIGGGGVILYAAAFSPGEFHAQATAVAQNFLTAQAQSTAQANAHATATTNNLTPEQVYQQATSGTPTIDDPLKDDSGNVWYNYGAVTAKNNCNFRAGAYHITLPDTGGSDCIGANTLFNNLAIQVQITVIKGQVGGLLIRINHGAQNPTAYGFEIDTQGNYFLYAVDQSQARPLKVGQSLAIANGLNHPNIITMIARDSHIYAYANGQNIADTIDTTYTSGQIALVGESTVGALDVAFNNVKVWAL